MIGTIAVQRGILRGTIQTKAKLTGAIFNPKGLLNGLVTVPYVAEIEVYAGDYEVTPQVSSQTLETAGKRMEDDVQIKAIPIYSVSNNSGGATFYIATGEPDSGVAFLGKSKLGELILK